MRPISPLVVLATTALAVSASGQNALAVVWNKAASEPGGSKPGLIASLDGVKGARETIAQTQPSMDKQLSDLETRFFLHDFARDTIDERITRLEKFTFGATHAGTPAQRLARVAGTLQTHSPSALISDVMDLDSKVSVPKPNSASRMSNPNDSLDGNAKTARTASEPADDTDYPHISYLENEILGQTYAGQSLSTRLQRMETKAFGSPSRSADLSDRTDALERYAESNLHKKAFIGTRDHSDYMDDAGLVSPMNVPAEAVLGGPMQHRPKFHGFNAFPEEPAEGQEVLKDEPPQAGARLVNRVAWCEMHTFGRTYPDMHLLKRLRQLNDNLFPNDKEKDIELMDHVDAIVKEVVLRQHPHRM